MDTKHRYLKNRCTASHLGAGGADMFRRLSRKILVSPPPGSSAFPEGSLSHLGAKSDNSLNCTSRSTSGMLALG